MPRAKAPVAVTISTPTPVVVSNLLPKPVPPPPPPEKAGPLWITVEEAAAELGVTREGLMRRAKEGLLGFKEGGRWRFSHKDLRRYVESIEAGYLKSLRRR